MKPISKTKVVFSEEVAAKYEAGFLIDLALGNKDKVNVYQIIYDSRGLKIAGFIRPVPK